MPNSANAIFRVEDAPDRHAGLTERLGSPGTCFAENDVKNERTGERWNCSLWTMESPLAASLDVCEHFAWASELAKSHEGHLASLIHSGVKVVLHLTYHASDGYSLFVLEAELLAPFVALKIPVEIYTSY